MNDRFRILTVTLLVSMALSWPSVMRQNWLRIGFFLVVVLAILSLSNPSIAQERDFPNQDALERMEVWRALPPERKEALRRTMRRWKTLPPERRAELRRQFKAFRLLPPHKKERLFQNFERFQKLSPLERDRLQRNLEHWRKLPPERRRELRRDFEVIQKMTPSERQRMIERSRRHDRRPPPPAHRPPVPRPRDRPHR